MNKIVQIGGIIIVIIIVVVIVFFILSLFGTICCTGARLDADEEAEKMINNLATKRGIFNVSGGAVFYSGESIHQRAVSDATRGILEQNQVCITPGDFKNDNRFVYEAEKSIVYRGTADQDVFVTAICDTGSSIAENPADYFERYTLNQIDYVQASVCGCVDTEFNETCCIISLSTNT
jgi:hypothetical protein